MEAIFIFYVANQQKSRDFYQQLLQQQPVLDVPGMTEFRINDKTKLGLMPETGIHRLLGDKILSPALARGIPRSEIYIYVNKPEEYYKRALAGGAKAVSSMQLRSWGDEVAYCADLDGHILAFALRK
jgi:hypothetical protein